MVDVTIGSGNVFEDVGFPPDEAAVMLAKADLMIDLRCFIRARRWTRKQASAYFGEPIPQINRLLDLDTRCFSVEQLQHLVSIAERSA